MLKNIVTILKTVVKEERYQSQLAQTQLREDELVTKVLGAIENLRTSSGSCEISTDEAGPETIQKDGASPGHPCPYRREKNGQGDNYRL